MKKDKPTDLRKQAEARLKKRFDKLDDLHEGDPQRLVHELRVHQVELEMQNEELRKSQAELEESRARYSDLYDFAPVGYFTFDKYGLIIRVNLTGAGQLGIERNLLIKKPFSRFIRKDDQDVFFLHRGKVFETKELQTCELRLKRKDGAGFYAQLQSLAVEDKAGRAVYCMTAVSDITERKLSEQALRELNKTLEQHVAERTGALRKSEERYHSLFENMVEGFAYCKMLFDDRGRPADFVYLDVNSAFGRLTGLENVIGKKVTEAIPGIKESHPELFEIYGRVALTGNPEKIDIEFVPLNIWLSLSVYSTEKGHFVAVFDNITERKRAEEALRKAYDDLEIRVQERTKELRELNETLEHRVAGRAAEMQAANTALQESRKAALNIMEDAIAARRQAEEVSEELAAVNKELDAFSYAVSNDLMAPLRSIEGFTAAITEDYAASLDKTAKDYFDRVTAASRRMSQLINAMLNMARLTRGELTARTVNLSDLAEVAAYELGKKYPERPVEIVIAKGVKALGDIDMLRVVIENLFDNAYKFTGRHPSAKIEFGVMEEEISHIGLIGPVYFVRDDGEGFDVEYAWKLFKPFSRLHAESEFPGIGIGLSTVQRIIRRHGGKIWADSAPGKGATFYFTLK